jgi:hypothetical protein
MNAKELELLDRFSKTYNISYELTNHNNSNWDFTYNYNEKKFYCEMKQRNFTLKQAKEKYPSGLILEMHKYERILRRTKNEKLAQGLYFNFFECDTALVFNLNKLRVKNWVWRTMPETTEYNRKKYIYKYVTFISYNVGKLFYI